ncbi:hypothetical protein ACFWN2_44725, partial [Lentzea sp. NPDC058436]|uniref:WXG100-like domain-containing protein n=1 Tax=Lentzea sp. NPDC058436 TaxID=3346499 RepID=UPI00364CEE20
MPLTFPPELDWLVVITMGQHFPRGDEDLLRANAAFFDGVVGDVLALGSVVGGVEGVVGESLSGAAGEEASRFLRGVRGSVPGVGGGVAGVGGFLRAAATEVEYAKLMIYVELVDLAFEFARAVAWAAATFGASLSVLAARVAATRVTVMGIVRRLALAGVHELADEVLKDLGVQLFQ